MEGHEHHHQDHAGEVSTGSTHEHGDHSAHDPAQFRRKFWLSLNKLLVENHLRTHVSDMFAGGEQDVAIEELLRVYELNNNRAE